MKINEVEQALGITKANIRFYEKEGLLNPGRTEKGYRNYTQDDLNRLKQIVIYRKLGIPVQLIADILDGVIPLQSALEKTIQTLNDEIEKLNGSLALCQQLKLENAQELDTRRYWDILQNKENSGFKFQSLVSDYINYVAPTMMWLYWIPEDAWRNPKCVLKYMVIWSILFAGLSWALGDSFSGNLVWHFFRMLCSIILMMILYIPVYRISKKYPELAKTLEVLIPVVLFLLGTGLVIWFLVSLW